MVRLGDVCTFYSGTGFPNIYQGKADGKYPFYKVGDISRNVLSGNRELKICENYIDDDTVTKIKGTLLPPQTVVFAKIGEALRLNRRAITSHDCLVDNNAMGIKSDDSIIDSLYFYYFMCNVDLQNYCESTTVPSVRKTRIAEIEIPLPPLDAQRRIAAVLDKVSDLIAKRRAQLDKLDLLVKARFVEMFEHVSDQVLLSDVAEVTGGLTKNSKRKDFPIKLPYLRVANVFFDTIDTNEILEIGLTEEEKRKTLLQNGDLLFVEGNGNPEQIGRVAVWQDEIVPCVHQNHLIKARFNLAKMLPTYAMNYFMTQKGREQIREKAVSTSGLYTLSVSKIESLHIPFAPMDRQLQFTDFKEKVDKSKLTIRQSLNKLETLKKALMQQYFG